MESGTAIRIRHGKRPISMTMPCLAVCLLLGCAGEPTRENDGRGGERFGQCMEDRLGGQLYPSTEEYQDASWECLGEHRDAP